MVKSGTDFKHFSIIRVQKNRGRKEEETKVEGNTTYLSSKWWKYEVELKEVNH